MKCDSHPRRKNAATDGGLWFAGALIILGTGFLLHQLGQLPRGMSPWHVWPSMVVWAGLLNLIGGRRNAERIWGGMLLVGGSVGQVYYLDLLPLSWNLIWPALLILAGVGIGLGSLLKKRDGSVNDGPAQIDAKVTMGERDERYQGREFTGGAINCVLAEYKLDLRGAVASPVEAVLDVDVVMGALKLWVPRDWQVMVQVTPIMGGVDEKQERPDPPARRLVLRGKVVMGAIEIKN
jgi:hypothetical protein